MTGIKTLLSLKGFPNLSTDYTDYFAKALPPRKFSRR